MVEGMDAERGTVTAGGRGYYLLGPMVFLEQVHFYFLFFLLLLTFQEIVVCSIGFDPASIEDVAYEGVPLDEHPILHA